MLLLSANNTITLLLTFYVYFSRPLFQSRCRSGGIFGAEFILIRVEVVVKCLRSVIDTDGLASGRASGLYNLMLQQSPTIFLVETMGEPEG